MDGAWKRTAVDDRVPIPSPKSLRQPNDARVASLTGVEFVRVRSIENRSDAMNVARGVVVGVGVCDKEVDAVTDTDPVPVTDGDGVCVPASERKEKNAL